MLKTYEIMIKDGQVTWLDEQPKITTTHRAIITILEEPTEEKTSAQKVSQISDQLNVIDQDHVLLSPGDSDSGEIGDQEKLKTEILIEKASHILAQLDGQKAQERIEEEIAKDKGMKKILAQNASQILAKLGGTQPDLKPIPRRRFQEMTDASS